MYSARIPLNTDSAATYSTRVASGSLYLIGEARRPSIRLPGSGSFDRRRWKPDRVNAKLWGTIPLFGNFTQGLAPMRDQTGEKAEALLAIGVALHGDGRLWRMVSGAVPVPVPVHGTSSRSVGENWFRRRR